MEYILPNSQRRGGVLVIILLLMLAGVVVPVGVDGLTATQQSDTRTLIIRSAGSPANYSVTINGTLTAVKAEQSDNVKGNQISGQVGGTSGTTNNTDTTDVIKYKGYITDFQSDTSKIRVTLDDTLINTSVLSGNYIQISHTIAQKNNTNTPTIRYSLTVTGTIVGEEDVEAGDEPSNTTTVTGKITSDGDRDGFYYTGEINSSSFSRNARVMINGLRVPIVNQRQSQNQPSTPTKQPQTDRSTETAGGQTHTLIIKQMNGSVGYVITVSGTPTIRSGEPSDEIAGHTVTGRVGGFPWEETSTDTKDVIRFTGQLWNFEYEDDGGEIQIILDGEQINPESLIRTPSETPPTSTIASEETRFEEPRSPPAETITDEQTSSKSTSSTKSIALPNNSSDSSFITLDIIVGIIIGGMITFIGGYLGFRYYN